MTACHPGRGRGIRAVALFLLLASAAHASEYRAFWVETFNTRLGTRAEIDAVINDAVASNANALFAQVRRRGDSWYLDTREPLTEVAGVGEPDVTGRWTLDPLRYLLDQAHARGIEVHAFVIVGAIFQGDPATRLPADPRHVFLQHVWQKEGSAQWATRTRSGETRFGTDYWLDLGHPDAATYTVDVLAHLVARYDVDGIHLDRIRYPEVADAGYNETSVARFNARHGTSGLPSASDPLWSDWRREQVTNFVRRLYVTVKAIRPATRVSAALITFGAGPSASDGFARTEPYTRVFQDWEGWAREGILDLLVPMVYKRDSVAAQAAQFEDWTRFAVATGPSIIGLGAYLNTIEGTMRQARFARGAGALGVNFYSLANPSEGQSRTAFFTAARELFTPAELPPPLVQTTGHLRGITRPDTVVTLEPGGRTTRSDGSGFFAFTHLAPGRYRVGACTADVEVGEVATLSCGPRRRAVPSR
jgi:uncharacterized lipoprotein YddW (UPF0748 family)